MVEFLEQLSGETRVLLTLSIILFSGFIMTRLTNTLNMPKVSGYILAGILIGPCCLNFIPRDMIGSMSFVSDLALAFIAFGVGKFFKKEVLLRTGKKIIVITISEALAAGVLVTLALKLLFGLNWEFALILGAIATATAPASTMMTINQYKAKGEFVDTLLQIVALDDVVCLLAFSIVSAVINGNAAGKLSVHDILLPVAYNIAVILLGVFCAYFLSRLLIPARSRDNRLILAIAMLLGLSGICAAIDISPLLSCMVFGAVYINMTKDKKIFRQINNFTPPVMSVFFIVSGMNLDLNALTAVGAVGVSYFAIRIVGKYLGTYLSCLAMKTSREVRNYMGLALIPQAGVAIGLAFLGQRMLPPETGNMMLTIILSSSVLYEMAGPVSAKAALLLSGSIPYIKGIEKVENGEKEEGGESAEDVVHIANEDDETEKVFETPETGQQESAAVELPDIPDADPDAEEEENHAILPELLEYSRGVDENDDYDIEKELKPQKGKKKKKEKEKEKLKGKMRPG
ncbi:MAG: cation:proton antiporter, partial [Lachnospiraceae bacterium]|nr:cation:proton antiporter [Lachnospiraceae bacterium]